MHVLQWKIAYLFLMIHYPHNTLFLLVIHLYMFLNVLLMLEILEIMLINAIML